MIYHFRLHTPENRTTLADDFVVLDNPAKSEIYDTLILLLSRGRVSCLITCDDGELRFYAHDLVVSLAEYLKGV